MSRARKETEIHRLQVAYEKFLRATVTYKTYVRYSDTLSSFVNLYPKKVNPTQYYVTDVEDWAVRRSRDVSAVTVAYEVNTLRYFFNWLRDYEGFTGPNPATRRKQIQSRLESTVSATEIKRLRSVAHGRDNEILTRMLQGEVPAAIAVSLGIAQSTLRQRYARLRSAADFPLNLKELRVAAGRLYLRLGRESLLGPQLTPPQRESEPSSAVPA